MALTPTNYKHLFKFNLRIFLASFALLYVSISSYVMPYGSFLNKEKGIFIIIPLYFGLSVFNNKKLFPPQDFLMFCGISLLLLLYWVFDIDIYGTGLGTIATIFIAYILLRKPIKLPAYYLYIIYLIMLFSIIYSFASSQYNGRILLNAQSPNIDGLVMILFFYYCRKNRLFFGQLLSLIAIFFLISRNYFLSISVFFFFEVFKSKLYLMLRKLKIDRIGILIFASILAVLVLSFYYVNHVKLTAYYLIGEDRLLQYADASNYNRFESNVFIMSLMQEDLHAFMFGAGEKPDEFFRKFSVWSPHNSFLQTLTTYGAIFTTFYLFIISKILNPYFSKDNLPYIMSYFFYLTFGQSGLIGVNLIFFMLIIAMPHRTVLRFRWDKSLKTRIPTFKLKAIKYNFKQNTP